MKISVKFLLLTALALLMQALYAETNPFSEGLKVNPLNSAIVIHDVDTAEAAEMVIADGFPVDGTISVGNSTLRLRSWPWGDVVANYGNGTSLKVIGESGEFFLVEIDGKQGYMHRNYISIPGAPASGEVPSYPGNTRNGGALSLNQGVEISKAKAANRPAVVVADPEKTAKSEPKKKTDNTPTQKVSRDAGGKILLQVPQKCQMQVKCPAPGSACGPTSLAMILSYYTGKNVDALATDLWNVCGSTKANGTGHAGLVKGAKKYGYPHAKWHYSVSQSWLKEQLNAGKPVLAHVKGHYVVIKGMDSSGKILFNDPGKSKVDRSMSFAEFSAWWRGAGSKHPCMVLE